MWNLADKPFLNRLILGTALYPSPEIMRQAILNSETQIATVSLRRQNPAEQSGIAFWEILQSCKVNLLPNTAGCHTVKEAVTTAHMAREIFQTNWIKLEITGDDYLLAPNGFATVEAARILTSEGFEVFPYTTEDLSIAEKLVEAGCRILMPWAAPIGSARGIANPLGLRTLRQRYPELTLIVDAGLGSPSQAAQAMEWGYDAVLLNTAVAKSVDPIKMAQAFSLAVRAGRFGYEAGLLAPRETAVPSTPIVGRPFWQEPT